MKIIYTVEINNQKIDIENIRGVNGIIFQLHIQNLNKLSNYVKKMSDNYIFLDFEKMNSKI